MNMMMMMMYLVNLPGIVHNLYYIIYYLSYTYIYGHRCTIESIDN